MSEAVQAIVTEYQTRWLINNRNLFLTVLEAESPKPGGQYGQVLLRTLLWVADGHLPTVSSQGGRDKLVLWGLFYKGTNPIHEGSTLMT